MDVRNKTHLLEVFNSCWNNKVFPRVWKKAYGKIVNKAGDRDWSSTKAYRLISILPTAGKILE